MTVRAILRAVEQVHGIRVMKFVRGGRNPTCVTARRDAMYLMRSALGMSFPAIAREFGMDHTSVMHGVRCVVSAILTDSVVLNRLDRIKEATKHLTDEKETRRVNELRDLRDLVLEVGRRLAALEVAA